MSSSKKPRIKRGPPPKKPIKRSKYRKAIIELLRDFDSRCAYSMQHQSRSGTLEVDHFDPKQKKDIIQQYSNLFPASRHCNGKKGDNWPNKAELAAGCRFLNPCEEMDYGDQIFEDPTTNKLIGVTPAAIWHIRICALNSDHLIAERRRRAKHRQTLEQKAIRTKRGASDETIKELIRSFREEVELMIPPIPAQPAT
jgi:hypothetical protein